MVKRIQWLENGPSDGIWIEFSNGYIGWYSWKESEALSLDPKAIARAKANQDTWIDLKG
jgi:hypothetical protein